LSLKQPRDKLDFRSDRGVRNVLDDDFPSTRSKDPRQRRLVTPVLIICALVAALVTVDYWSNASRIYPGVEVGGISLGHKTHEEAREIVENQLAGVLKEIELTGPEEITLSSERMGMNLDVWATVDRAYAVGRQGSILERLGDRMQASWDTVRVSPVVDYQREVVQNRIENLAAQLNKEPEDAYVTIEGSEAKVVESREGYAVNVAATMANVDEAINDMSGEAEIAAEVLEPVVLTPAAQATAERAEEVMSDEPVVLRAEGEEWELSPEKIGQSLSFVPKGGELQVGLDRERLRRALSNVIEDLTVEPVEAGYKLTGNSISVTQSQPGKEVEEKKLFDDLEAGLFAGKRDYEVPVLTAEPNLTTEEAEKLKPTDLLGTYRTSYTLSSDKSPERVENLQIASNAISGTILAPGEIFSANEILAPLNYNETKVIVLGKEEKADGGGLCQVSSTLYMAATYAGLEIVERHPHQAQLAYIRPGLDATVWFGALDMKFENTTDGYLFIQESVGDDGFIYASIYGRPTGKEVEMDSEPEYLGSDYSEWITYKKVTENGKVVSDDVLYKTTYRPLVDEKGKTIPPNDPYLNIAPVNY
jgi:vancomycin resistance protein YoaR